MICLLGYKPAMKVNWRMRRKLAENNKTKNIINSFFHVHCSFQSDQSCKKWNPQKRNWKTCWWTREVYVAYTFLAHISSALNPLIYGVLNKNFRIDYLKLLCCRYCRSPVVVEPLAMDGRVNFIKMRQALHELQNASN